MKVLVARIAILTIDVFKEIVARVCHARVGLTNDEVLRSDAQLVRVGVVEGPHSLGPRQGGAGVVARVTTWVAAIAPRLVGRDADGITAGCVARSHLAAVCFVS